MLIRHTGLKPAARSTSVFRRLRLRTLALAASPCLAVRRTIQLRLVPLREAAVGDCVAVETTQRQLDDRLTLQTPDESIPGPPQRCVTPTRVRVCSSSPPPPPSLLLQPPARPVRVSTVPHNFQFRSSLFGNRNRLDNLPAQHRPKFVDKPCDPPPIGRSVFPACTQDTVMPQAHPRREHERPALSSSISSRLTAHGPR